MPEQVAANIAGDRHERVARDPARQPPQQVVGGDQREQQRECHPDILRTAAAARERVDQELDAVLGAHRAHHRGQHRS